MVQLQSQLREDETWKLNRGYVSVLSPPSRRGLTVCVAAPQNDGVVLAQVRRGGQVPLHRLLSNNTADIASPVVNAQAKRVIAVEFDSKILQPGTEGVCQFCGCGRVWNLLDMSHILWLYLAIFSWVAK